MSSARILVVEDELIVAQDLENRLRRLGYEVVAAVDTGGEAITAARQLRPDLVLMDIRLRGPMDGIEAAIHIGDELGIPLIYLTAHADVATVERARKSAPFGYVLKPFDERELATTIEMVLYRHAAERRLRELTLALSFALPGISRLDASGRYVDVSDEYARLFGYEVHELLGRNWTITVLPEDRPPAAAASRRVIDEGKGEWECRGLRKDGSTFHQQVSMVVILDRSGAAIGEHCFAKDVSARKQLEEERRALEAKIQHSQKLESLGVLAGGIAHDFNNLLTGILGHADLALMKLDADSPARASIEQVILGARRAAELTQQMLAYSGRSRFQVQPLSLSELVAEMAQLLEVSIARKCRLDFRLAREIAAVEADPVQVRQVVMNLLLNAAEAIGERGGTIQVRTGEMDCDRGYLDQTWIVEGQEPGRYAFLEVVDDGCGMNAEVRQRIFDPFFTTKSTGRGLGLAAVLGIVRSHHGALKLASDPGRGTAIRVLFPVSDKRTRSLAPPSDGNASSWRGGGIALVIDDEDAVRMIAGDMLKRLGFEVVGAADGRAGIAAFKERMSRVRVVLLDMMMPQLSGEETFRELRRLQPDVRVILSSGYGEETATNGLVSEGLCGFLQKPYRFADLSAAVRRALGTEERAKLA